MPAYRQVKLTDGQVIRVYMPPMVRISIAVERAYPLPDPPTVSQQTATGETIEVQIVDDPDYLRAKAQVEQARAQKRDELIYLFALRDLAVPDDFDPSIYAPVATLENPSWKPREGSDGRKLDYIEWEILGDPVNWNTINKALSDLITVDQEVVERIENSF